MRMCKLGPKLLFVTTRNVLTTCGELRLVKNRAESLWDEYSIATDFLVLGKRSRIESACRERISAGGEMFEASYSGSLSFIRQYLRFLKSAEDRLASGEYFAVVLSGIGTERFAASIKKRFPNIKVILDVHGAAEDSLEIARESSLVYKVRAKIIYDISCTSLKIGLKHVDGCFVVSKALREYIEEMNRTKRALNYYLVPCSPHRQRMSDDYLAMRQKYRNRYFLNKDTLVFVYSGGASPWQCVAEAVALFKDIRSRVACECKMLIFSHQIESIQEIVGEDEDVIFDSYHPEELASALYAGDFAFLLRENNVTNNVAFPNKFFEYVSSGMKIIATPYVYDVAQMIESNNLGCLYDGDVDCVVDFILSHKDEKAEDALNHAKRLVEDCSFGNTLSAFVEECKEWR